MLSGLSGVTAAEHLKKIAGIFGVSAGVILAAYSQLPTGEAIDHLLVDRQVVEETIQLTFGGSGWNFDESGKKITGKNKLGELIEIEDEEIIEFLTVFAMWRSRQV
jgi:hypothetical protein